MRTITDPGRYRTGSAARLALCALMIVMACLLCACSGNNNSDPAGVNASAEKVIRTVITYPNEELYDPDDVTVIGLGTVPGDDGEDPILDDKNKWKGEIGDCFAGDMFDNFYNDLLSMDFLGHAYYSGYESAEVTDLRVEDNDPDDELEHIFATVKAVTKDGSNAEFVIEWLAKYDKADSSLLQSLTLMDDGGYLDPIPDDVDVSESGYGPNIGYFMPADSEAEEVPELTDDGDDIRYYIASYDLKDHFTSASAGVDIYENGELAEEHVFFSVALKDDDRHGWIGSSIEGGKARALFGTDTFTSRGECDLTEPNSAHFAPTLTRIDEKTPIRADRKNYIFMVQYASDDEEQSDEYTLDAYTQEPERIGKDGLYYMMWVKFEK